MATNKADGKSDFDLSSLFSGPVNIMTGVFGMVESGRKTIAAVAETIASLQRAAAAVERLAQRLDTMADEMERPIKLLGPELEKATERMFRIADAFEVPIDRFIPTLERAIGTLDRVGMNQLPDTLEMVREQMAAVIDGFADLPRRFAPFADLFPGFDRLLTRRPAATPARQTLAPQPVAIVRETAAGPGPAGGPMTRVATKKAPAKQTPAKKAAAKKVVAKKAPTKKAAAK